jgi:predicted RNA-binding protein (virulence factor B family)
MVEIGKYNDLYLLRFCEQGAILDGQEAGEILMPKITIRDWMKVGDLIHVFVYPDSNDRLVGTREKPYAVAGEFAFLQVELTNQNGAYLEWGVRRRLFVPIREQRARMHEEGVYLVYIVYDEKTKRLYGSAKYEQYIDKGKPPYEVGDAVNILIAAKTDLGYKAIIDNQYMGMLYANELFDKLEPGHIGTAYIKRVRDDYKIDLSLSKIGQAHISDFAEELHRRLIDRGGYLAMNDNTEPEAIYELFGVSKKTFKKAIGDLYRKRLITIDDNGIQLIENTEE